MERRPARPTIRCLLEDLAPSLEDANLARHVKNYGLQELHVPLSELPHPLIGTVRDKLTDSDPAVEDHVSAVRDNTFYKDRHGQWRGFIWLDRTEEYVQPWIVFAGLRREGDRSDAYETFTRECSNGSAGFLPDQRDRDRLALEVAIAAETARSVRIRRDVAEAVITAAGAPAGTIISTPILDETGEPLAHARIDIVGGDIGEMYLSIEIAKYDVADYYDILNEVLEAVPGIVDDEWSNVPPRGEHRDPIWYALISPVWLERFQQAVAADGIEQYAESAPDLTDGHDGFFHVVKRPGLVDAIVSGRAVVAVCGRRFVPNEDHIGLEPCPECRNRIAAHERLRTSE